MDVQRWLLTFSIFLFDSVTQNVQFTQGTQEILTEIFKLELKNQIKIAGIVRGLKDLHLFDLFKIFNLMDKDDDGYVKFEDVSAQPIPPLLPDQQSRRALLFHLIAFRCYLNNIGLMRG